MAGDTVTVTTLLDNEKFVGVHLTCISDGTGETLVKKVDISALAPNKSGNTPQTLDLIIARWAMQGIDSVRLFWDNVTNPDVLIMALSGNGFEDFRGPPGGVDNLLSAPPKRNPYGATDTPGDILLTSAGAVANGTYDITLWFQKVPLLGIT